MLSSRIVPPPTPAWYAPRRADLFAHVLDRRLTVLVAGPGSGKSCALAHWAAANPVTWYTVDGADPRRFAAGLVNALRSHLPKLDTQAVEAAAAVGIAHAEVATAISAALEGALRSDMALIVDDAHELGRAGTGPQILESLVRQAPRTLHIVISSRSEPPFSIERLRGQGEVVDVDARSLALSTKEIASVLELVVGADAAGLASDVYRLTGGWPAAVRLAVEAVRRTPATDRLTSLAELARPGGGLYAYLAEEVFARERPAARHLLQLVAPLRRFTPELCTFLGARKPAHELGQLLRRGLFIDARAGSERWFALHPLAGEFLKSRPGAAESGSITLRRAADWFIARGYREDALGALIDAKDTRAVTAFLSKHGTALIASGNYTLILDAGAFLGDDEMGNQARILVGEAACALGQIALGRRHLARAAGDGASLPGNLVARIGLSYLDHPREALAILSRGLQSVPETEDDAFVLGLAAQATCALGDLDTAHDYAERSLSVARQHAWPWAEAEACLSLGMVAARGGDVAQAHAHYRAAQDAAARAGNAAQLATAQVRIAALLVESGRYGDALHAVSDAIGSADAIGLAGIRAWSRCVRAEAYLGLGRLDDALDDADAARDIYEQLGAAAIIRALRCLGDVLRERGDVAIARSSYETALARAGDDLTLDVALIRAGLARLVVTTDAEEAARLARDAAAMGTTTPATMAALLSAGWVELWQGRRERAERFADMAAAEARRRGSRPTIAESLELHAAATSDSSSRLRWLGEAAGIWRDLGSPIAMARVALAEARFSQRADAGVAAARAEQQLRSFGVRVSSAADAAGLLAFAPWPESAPVSIQSLGGFRVLRGGVPADIVAWRRSRKAQQLLKILVAQQGRPLPREALMEALWPEADPEELPNRFSVALNSVRHVLDPDRRHPADHYVVSSGDGIAIDRSRLPVDVERFLALAEAGLSLRGEGDGANAAELLEAAEASYSGDFLAEDLYEDWATPLRDEARQMYRAVASWLAERAASSGTLDRAVRLLLRILSSDGYDEDVHVRLVAVLLRAGQHGAARRRYRAYVARMAEIGVEPVPFPVADAPPTSGR